MHELGCAARRSESAVFEGGKSGSCEENLRLSVATLSDCAPPPPTHSAFIQNTIVHNFRCNVILSSVFLGGGGALHILEGCCL